MKKVTALFFSVILILFAFVSCAEQKTENTSYEETITSSESAQISSVEKPTEIVPESTGENYNTDVPLFVVEKVECDKNAKNVPVKIMVMNNPGIASIGITVDFDKNTMKLVNYEINQGIGGYSVEYNSNVSSYKIIWLDWEKDIKGNFVFATLYFDILSDEKGEYPVSIMYDSDDVYNIEETNLEFGIINGSITVK